MSRLPPVLYHADLPEAELHAAKLDGEVYPVGQCFSPIDEIEGRVSRARSLALSVPGSLIAEQRTAAWIHGALSRPPRRHQFCADIAARTRPSALIAISVREVVIEERDLLTLAGLRLTTPLRTVVDLARNVSDFDDDELSVIGDLMRIGRFDAVECRANLDRRRNLPNKRLALERIDEAARRIHTVSTGQPPLTRYTS
ncbi:type IV toxin-antitoxin system AbiEi family antitoxin [Lacisediminihabitans sp. FW035]